MKYFQTQKNEKHMICTEKKDWMISFRENRLKGAEEDSNSTLTLTTSLEAVEEDLTSEGINNSKRKNQEQSSFLEVMSNWLTFKVLAGFIEEIKFG